MKHLLLSGCFVALASQVHAIDLAPAEASQLATRLKSAVDATRQGDARAIVELTHPALINAVGGKQRMEDMTRDALTWMQSQGFELLAVETSSPACPPPIGSHRYCFVPKVTTIKVGGRVGKEHSFLVAVREAETSEDWLFLDGAAERRNPGVLQKLLPWLPSDAQFPPSFIEPPK